MPYITLDNDFMKLYSFKFIRYSLQVREKSWNINVIGTWNMLEASIRRGIQSFTFASSSTTLHRMDKPTYDFIQTDDHIS